MMWNFLLLILSLMTGCVASFKVKGCKEGWAEFTCKYPEATGEYRRIVVKPPEQSEIRSSQNDVWETKGRFSLYHDTQSKQLKVAIKQLEGDDFDDEYKCKFRPKTSNQEDQEVKIVEERGCRRPFHQTAYRAAKTTIVCDYPEHGSSVKFFCKEKKDSICEDILSTKSSPNSNGTFTLTETDRGFNIYISNVSSHDAGVYWCGVKNEGHNRTGLRKIQLEVTDINDLIKSPVVGQTFTYMCKYPEGTLIKKIICKGEDPSTCQRLVSTSKATEKFSIEDKKAGYVTVTVRDVTTDDTGTYWCGAESTDRTRSNLFFHRLLMTVVPTTSTASIISSTSHHPVATSSVSSTQSMSGSAEGDMPTSAPSIMSSTPHHPGATSSASSTQSASGSAEGDGGSWLTVVIAAVCVAVLVLVLVLFLIYKRFECSKNTNGEAQNKEDGAYDEIQERPQKPNSGTALKTIYATANFPTNPSSASHQYSYIDFQNSSAIDGADPYSTVRDNDQHHTYSTVNHPSTVSADPFYSTVNMPQQH